jgi:hypothetical protein
MGCNLGDLSCWGSGLDLIVYVSGTANHLPGARPSLGNLLRLPGHQAGGKIPDKVAHLVLGCPFVGGGTPPDGSLLCLLDGIEYSLVPLDDGLNISGQGGEGSGWLVTWLVAYVPK